MVKTLYSILHRSLDLTELFEYITNNTCIPQIGKIPYLKNLKYVLKSEKEKQNLIREWHLNV